jgi:hypothetical protein
VPSSGEIVRGALTVVSNVLVACLLIETHQMARLIHPTTNSAVRGVS